MIAIPRNPRSPALPSRLAAKAEERGIPYRVVHLETLRSTSAGVVDAHGPVRVTHLAPGTTHGEIAAQKALARLETDGAKALNPLGACVVADDKIRTSEAFRDAGLCQPRWAVMNREDRAAPAGFKYPFVLKRPSGALGMWNRIVGDEGEIGQVMEDLLAEGGEQILVQDLVTEAAGRSLRVVVLQDRVLAATELVARPGEWRSNGALGATGYDVELTDEERDLAVAGLAAVGLGYGGVDLLRCANGPLLLEVNPGSPFDGAERRTGRDIAGALLDALLEL